jgi:hypothetical protein
VNPDPNAWKRLTEAARRAPAEGRDESAPYGFAARVAAQAFAGGPVRSASLFESFSLRALGVASVLAVAATAAGVPAVIKAVSRPEPVAANASPSIAPAAPSAAAPAASPASDDPVSDMVDMVS